MKKTFILSLLILFSCNFLTYSQEVNTRKNHPDVPMIFAPKNHDPNFLKAGKISEKSFYQRKSEWQHIIDSTWGPGAPLNEKLTIFNDYAHAIHDNFDGLYFLKYDWDSIYNHYLNQIKSSTSKGAFSAIMSHFANAFKDLHTMAFDPTVITSPLNPGVPVLLIGSYFTVEHFGAVTTVLPDSTTLVLRVVPNHPLNLEPGDIILGYEGVPWKNLVRELRDGGLPMFAETGGCKSADTYLNLGGAGLNWHLFGTIDILKHSTGTTLHLSLQPMLNLVAPPMANNEQLTIKNIPFPRVLTPNYPPADTVVTFGVLENTNIGYIFLAGENEIIADIQLREAVKALKNTDALIIDMRLNFGGSAVFDEAFNILFNEYHKTLEHAGRCNKNTFELCPYGDWARFQINGKDPDYYDRPIAVLLGPTCMSDGDWTAQRLRYHPMVRFFGASSGAALGQVIYADIPLWVLQLSAFDMFHISEPGVYLNRKEFPIDYPVWFNKEDVAEGKDPIVAKSLQWIDSLVYGHNVVTDKMSYLGGSDTLKIDAIIENPYLHSVSAKLIFESLDGSFTDSTDMAALNLAEGNKWQGKWIAPPPPADNTYWISLKATDNTSGTYFTNKHVSRITTTPIVIDSISCVSIPGSKYNIKPFLKNEGITQGITYMKVNLESIDPWVKSISPAQVNLTDLWPGQISGVSTPFSVTYDTSFPGYFNLKFTISSDGWPYWEIDTSINIGPHGIREESLSSAYKLNQNYPNPFFTSTDITFNLPSRSFVTLKIYDLGGREVATLVSEELPAGEHLREWNAAEMPGGIYFYRLQAGVYAETRKLVLLK